MNPNSNLQRLAIVLAMIGVAVASRLLPHPPNFTPLAAMCLFAGAVTVSPRIMAAAVIIAMLVSDAVLGFHSLMPVVYGCLLANVFIGRKLLGANANAFKIVAGSLIGSVLFFLVTNLGVWFVAYPSTLTGLTACFTAAIPFFQYTLAGDLLYTGLFFGVYALAANSVGAVRGKLQLATVPARVGE
ncbi:DUF6580 family putative transport protein [Rhodopirellula bahusiensis]|uniref:ECF transporter S component n=1 Tax=Rhodopirellula bahusiensis TaxID=2014065 RepID=A0A2G1W696_9BACT|nr:DUF6580 family putative transport protein [Rhodopirellula bahusiensis]PHQ34552.1 hypothetical protein CEE69_14120 [Rhodopirellula bahusiensis]